MIDGEGVLTRRMKQAVSVPVVAMLLVSGCGGDDDAPVGESEGVDDVAPAGSVGGDARKIDEGVG